MDVKRRLVYVATGNGYTEPADIASDAVVAFNMDTGARAWVKQDGTRPVPMHLRNAPTKLMKQLDYGKGYRYAHDEAGGFAAGENYLPEGMPEPGFYQPVERGFEREIVKRLEYWNKLRNKRNS